MCCISVSQLVDVFFLSQPVKDQDGISQTKKTTTRNKKANVAYGCRSIPCRYRQKELLVNHGFAICFPFALFAANIGGAFSLDVMQPFTTYFLPKRKGYQPLFVRLVTSLLAGDSIRSRVDAGFSREGIWLRNRNEIRSRGSLGKKPCTMHVMHLEREHLATDAQLACQHPCLSLIDFLLPSSFFSSACTASEADLNRAATRGNYTSGIIPSS